MEREFVTGIGGSTNVAKRGEIDVESGEVIEGELCFFGRDGGEGNTLADATKL